MSINAQYVGTPKSPSVRISTANTNRDGSTGVYGTLFTAGSVGGRIDAIRINAIDTTTSGMIRFFVGTALILEVPVIAVTPSATTPAWGADIVFDNGLILGSTVELKVSTHNAESFNVTVISGGDF